MENAEIWLPVPSVPGYEASSWGRIRRTAYVRPMPRGGLRTYGGIAWPGAWDASQRRFVVMFRRKTYRVARMVCEAFHGSPPEGKPNCLHGDEDSQNNRPGNLSWGSQEENLNAPGFIAHCRARAGANSAAAMREALRRQSQ